MKRRALLLAAVTVGCSRSRPRHGSELARLVLGLSQRAASATSSDVAWSSGELERIAARAARRHAAGSSPASAIAQVLFDELGFVREVESTELEFLLLPSVLQRRRGSCVGLGTVYLAVAETLGFVAHGVLRPGHFYVRQAFPAPACNVELLRRGERMTDRWYSERFPLRHDGAHSYARPLTVREVLGVTAFNVGNQRRREQRLELAQRAYREAVVAFPSFAEAHAGLGTIEHLLGSYAAAAESYRHALALDAALPGVEANLALLSGSATAP